VKATARSIIAATIYSLGVMLTYALFDPRKGCAMLVEDPRHAAFPRTLMARPVASTRTPDPSLAAVVFLSLRTGWSGGAVRPRAVAWRYRTALLPAHGHEISRRGPS
jgi:hypothetical protein